MYPKFVQTSTFTTPKVLAVPTTPCSTWYNPRCGRNIKKYVHINSSQRSMQPSVLFLTVPQKDKKQGVMRTNRLKLLILSFWGVNHHMYNALSHSSQLLVENKAQIFKEIFFSFFSAAFAFPPLTPPHPTPRTPPPQINVWNLDWKYHKLCGILRFNYDQPYDFLGKCKEKSLDIYNIFPAKVLEQPLKPFLIFKNW